MKFKSKRPTFQYLRKKWTAKNRQLTENVLDKHLRRAAVSSLGGLMILSTSGLSSSTPAQALDLTTKIQALTTKNLLLVGELSKILPREFRNLTPDEEQVVAKAISDELGIKVVAEIDNKRLNRTYGIIGGEQHLYRYPGDSLVAHPKSAQDWAMYGGAGIAPGLGAWGYFAPSKEAMTPEIENRERYYIAVQTFLSPGFAERVAEYRDFYKYRKMLLVNPKTGQAVVADIADAGPAEWTGKHLGGSPEVMQALGLATGPRRGEVLYFFIDDSNRDVPLGPVNIPINQ